MSVGWPIPLFEQPWPEGDYRFFQLGFVVDDLVDAAARWAAVFGVGPFHVLPPTPAECPTRRRSSTIELQVAVAQSGPVQIELIHQRCDTPSIFRDHHGKRSDRAPPALHGHRRLRGQGRPLRARRLRGREGARSSPAHRVAFIDTVADFGFYTEVVESRPGVPRPDLSRHRPHLRGVGRHRSRPAAHAETATGHRDRLSSGPRPRGWPPSTDCSRARSRSDGADRFRAERRGRASSRAFGGTLVAQALTAATATVTGTRPELAPRLLRAGGHPDRPRRPRASTGCETAGPWRPGRSRLDQGGRTLLVDDRLVLRQRPTEPDVDEAVLRRPAPVELPAAAGLGRRRPEALRPESSSSWVDRPPAVEIRIAEAAGVPRRRPDHGLRGRTGSGCPAPSAPIPSLHAALLAYASDFLLLDMAFRSHPVPFTSGRLMGTSLDHSVWFHRPVRFDGWHRYTQETVALAGERGLVRGSIHDDEGHLVASTAQEVLVRAG